MFFSVSMHILSRLIRKRIVNKFDLLKYYIFRNINTNDVAKNIRFKFGSFWYEHADIKKESE